MKSLNRAIGRTVSQLARFGGDEYHPLMKHALVQHLSFLLAMERTQLELSGMKETTLTGDGTGQALPELAQYLHTQLHPGSTRAMDDWTPGMVDRFNRMEPEQLRPSQSATEGDPDKLAEQRVITHYKTGVLSAFDTSLQQPPSAASEQPVPPAPDVINMANPANWLPGDTLLRKTVHGNFPHFTSGKQYTVTSNGPDVLTIMGNNGVEVTYPHKPFCEPASNFFTWLRHGEAQQ